MIAIINQGARVMLKVTGAVMKMAPLAVFAAMASSSRSVERFVVVGSMEVRNGNCCTRKAVGG